MAGVGGLAGTPVPQPAGNPPAPAVPVAAPTAPSAVTSDVQAQIDKANAATLAQLAGSTQAGVNAGNAAQAAGQADKAKAVQGLLTSAIMGGTGAPQQGVTSNGAPNQAQALQGILGGAYDQRIGTTGDLTAAFQAANANRAAGASNYFQEASAAIPIAQAAAAARIAAANIAAQQAAETHQLALESAQARAAAATAPPTPGKALSDLGGSKLAGDAILKVANNTPVPGLSGGFFTRASQVAQAQPGMQDQIGASAGLAPGQGSALVADNVPTPPAVKVPSDTARLTQIQGASDYPQIIANVARDLPVVGYAAMIARVQATHPGMPYHDADLIVGDAYAKLSSADKAKVPS